MRFCFLLLLYLFSSGCSAQENLAAVNLAQDPAQKLCVARAQGEASFRFICNDEHGTRIDEFYHGPFREVGYSREPYECGQPAEQTMQYCESAKQDAKAATIELCNAGLARTINQCAMLGGNVGETESRLVPFDKRTYAEFDIKDKAGNVIAVISKDGEITGDNQIKGLIVSCASRYRPHRYFQGNLYKDCEDSPFNELRLGC